MAITAPVLESICERFARTARARGDELALCNPGGEEITWSRYRARVREAAAGLAGLGLGRGDVLACWLSNRLEFHVADAAAMHVGATSFSIYNTFTVEQAKHVTADAGARILVTEPAFADRAIAVRASGDTALVHIVCVEGGEPEALGWDELLDAAPAHFNFEATWRAVQPSDLATLIYTSGTTGPPKGVELTHANIAAQTIALAERLELPEASRVVSFLPMAHIAERLCTHYFPMFLGWEVTCCPDAREVTSAIAAVRPGYFFSPPRIWEKLRAAVCADADADTRAALELAIDRVRSGDGPQDGAVQAAIRERIGFDALEVAIVGAAPSAPELIEFWHACGVPLSELYGMSETTGVATVAGPGAVRVGTVGPPLPVCDVRLSATGEILMRGPVLMRGYRNLPGETAEAFDADGWLRSGDIGALDSDGHLRIVDRIKDLIINAAGKNMSPANIEAILRADASLVGQACAVGDGRPFNVALLTLDPDGAWAFARQSGIEGPGLAGHRKVLEAVREEVRRANGRLARVEQIKRFALLGDEWLPDSEELTPTMKLKRRPIHAKYAATIAGLYDGSCGIDV
ncbi:MAG: AMP-dependent synthetase/ligase [Solirubrobacteraceae bacterium]